MKLLKAAIKAVLALGLAFCAVLMVRAQPAVFFDNSPDPLDSSLYIFENGVVDLGQVDMAEVKYLLIEGEDITALSLPQNELSPAGALREIDISNTSVREIADMQFKDYVSLEIVLLPASLAKIGEAAFQGSALVNLELAGFAELEEIGPFAFEGSTLRNVYMSGCTWLVKIGESAFENCTGLRSVSLRDCVALAEIGKSAFANSSLSEIDLRGAGSLESLPEQIFYNCTNLNLLMLSGCDKLSQIGPHAFENNENLLQFDFSAIPELRIIGSNAFFQSGLRNLSAPDSKLESIGDFAFSRSGVTSADFSGSAKLVSVGESAFAETPLRDVSFSGCAALTIVGRRAFYSCVLLNAADFDGCAALSTIADSAFGYRGLITTLDFSDCPALSNLTTLSFAGLSQLESVVFNGTATPPSGVIDWFLSRSINVTLRIPAFFKLDRGDAVHLSGSDLLNGRLPLGVSIVTDPLEFAELVSYDEAKNMLTARCETKSYTANVIFNLGGGLTGDMALEIEYIGRLAPGTKPFEIPEELIAAAIFIALAAMAALSSAAVRTKMR